MKEINCNVIKDILPIYIEDIVSEDTKKIVEEHLESCEMCRKEEANLRQTIYLPTNVNMEKNIFKELKKYFTRKKVKITLITFISCVILFFSTHFILTTPFFDVKFEDLDIEQFENSLNLTSRGNIYYYGANSEDIHDNDFYYNKDKITVFYFKENLWNKLTKNFRNITTKTYYFEEMNNPDKIYYYNFEDVSHNEYNMIDIKKIIKKAEKKGHLVYIKQK